MRRTGLTLALVAGLLAAPVHAADHLVTRADVARRLGDARQARAADQAAVRELLATPAASEAAARVGADLGRARASVAALDDADLRDLAQRARALRSDPAAGIDKDIHDLLVLFLIVAIVILVLQAVD
jgi:hypothetical protein